MTKLAHCENCGENYSVVDGNPPAMCPLCKRPSIRDTESETTKCAHCGGSMTLESNVCPSCKITRVVRSTSPDTFRRPASVPGK